MPEKKSADTELPGLGMDYLARFNGLGQHNATMLTRANEIISDTARAIWTREVELMRLEADQIARVMTPRKPNGDGVGEYWSRYHEGAEKVIAEMRQMSDLVRDCNWQLFSLCAEAAKTAAKPVEKAAAAAE